MSRIILLALLTTLAAPLTAPALAGDATKGETEFKKCKACHSITGPDGTAIQKGGRTGPNLYGVMGRAMASDPAFSYGPSLAELGAAGKTWDEESFVTYLADPAGFLKENLDSSARSKMTFKLGKGGEDIAAYLASVTAP